MNLLLLLKIQNLYILIYKKYYFINIIYILLYHLNNFTSNVIVKKSIN